MGRHGQTRTWELFGFWAVVGQQVPCSTDSHGLTFARVHLLLAQQNSMRPTVSLQGLNVMEMSILGPYALPDSKALDTPQ